MKKKLFFMPFLAAALFSCSEKGLVTGGDDVTNGESEISYLSVNIVSSQEAGTRATDDFKVGSEAENKVNSIRFYFFDEEGKAAIVKGNGATYYDVTADEISNDYNTSNAGSNQNIESTVSAVIVIESPKGDKKPHYIAAVVNPTSETPTLTAKQDDVTKLQEAVKDFSTTNGFVMSSSVYKAYVDEKGNEIEKPNEASSTPIEYIMVPVYDNIKNTRLEALENKATIYVERVLAKVSVSVNIETSIQGKDGSNLYEVGTVNKGNASEEVNDGVNDGAKIYVKFLGWNVTGTRRESRLVKKINTKWDEPFGGWNFSWNDATVNQNTPGANHHRSYWAINPQNGSSLTPIESNYHFENYNEAKALPFETSESGDGGKKYNHTYLQENAGKYENGTEKDIMTSKIIVAAQLVDEKDNPLELVEWGGDVYVKSEKLMNALASATQVYTVTGEGEKTYTPLTGEAIELVHKTVSDADEASKADSPRYYVSIALTNQSADTQYAVYTYKDGSYTYEEITDTNKKVLEDALASVGKIKYWNTGYTYYWVDIKHLGGDVTVDSAEEKKDGIGKYGVVRNHWYDYTFTSVMGLGVPVPDPGETIYPETPKDEDLFYLAAEIKILSWRMVQHNNEGLGWD